MLHGNDLCHHFVRLWNLFSFRVLFHRNVALFRIFPHNILFPGIFLAVTVLAVNMLGDGLRDSLDPRMRNRI